MSPPATPSGTGSSTSSTSSGIPSIDLGPIRTGDPGSGSSRVVLEALRAACSGIGFVTVTGHGVPRALIEETVVAAHAFFALSEEAKRRVAPRRWNPGSANHYRGYFPSSANGKEGLDIGDPSLEPGMTDLTERPYYEVNRFPPELDTRWGRTVSAYFAALSSLGGLLLRALVEALGGDPGSVERAFARPRALSTLRFNYYPVGGPVEISRQDGVPLSCETHVDSGFLTILHQGDVGGLQVRDSQGCWRDVPCEPDTLVVNTGLALQRVSQRALAATRHRVLLVDAPRLSIPFFFEPAHDFAVEAASVGLGDPVRDGAPSYESFLREALGKFAEYDRDAPA